MLKLPPCNLPFLIILLVFMLSGVSAQTAPVTVTEKFHNYAVGSSGDPDWDARGIGFEVQDTPTGKALAVNAANGGGFNIWRKAPLAHALTVETTITPHQALDTLWKTAGVAIYLNDANYWHLALVEGPATENKRHFVELSEMLDGNWNAQVTPPTVLKSVADSGPFDWQYGQTYRLRLTLTHGQIIGELFEGATLRYRTGRQFDQRAVTLGRPALLANFMTVTFNDAQATSTALATPAEIAQADPAPAFPPYPGQAVNAPSHFFRTENRDGAWWLLDPSGARTLSIGTDHVNYNGHFSEKLGYAPYHRNVAAKYGSEAQWAQVEANRLKAWHFNSLGTGQSPSMNHRGLTHTEFMSFGADFSSIAAIVPKTTWTGWPDVFDPRFSRFCDLRAKQRCVPNKDDPWLVGYYLDNELEWWGKAGHKWGLAEEAWKQPATSTGKQALVAILRKFYVGAVAGFNTDFGASIKSFDELSALQDPKQPVTEHGQQALMEFVRAAAQQYFQITTAAVRRYDSHHLVLGCRFAFDAPQAAWEWAGQTCDVVTVNIYPHVDLDRGMMVGLAEHLEPRHAWCQKPMMITEWGFPALDAKDSTGRPIPSMHGAGMRVDTQAQKARCYAITQQAFFSFPYVIGSNFFMWTDEPALGISASFPEDSNYGLVNESDEPYSILTATVQRINPQMKALHEHINAELEVRVKNKLQGDHFIVRNSGVNGVTFTVATWVNGERHDQRLTLRAKESQDIALSAPLSPAIYRRVLCDPDNEVVEQDKNNNMAESLTVNSTTQSTRIVVVNPTADTLHKAVVEITDKRINDLVKRFGATNLVLTRPGSVGLNILPQLTPVGEGVWKFTATLDELPPYAATVFDLVPDRNVYKRAPHPQSTVTYDHTATGYTVDNGALQLVKNEAGGDAFDHIYLRHENQATPTELGHYSPLIQQFVNGQNIWVQPDRVVDVKMQEQSASRLVLDVTFAKDAVAGTKVITAVDPTGKAAPLTVTAQPFRCAYRLTFEAGQPWFLAQCLWLENTGPQAWQWRGYFHYATSRIGGDMKDDEVGGAAVPDYYLNVTAWRDPNLKIDYGLLPLRFDDRLSLNFWKDEAGNEHPDALRKIEGALKPGERWQPKEPEPVMAIFGLRETDADPRPWRALLQDLQARAAVRTMVF